MFIDVRTRILVVIVGLCLSLSAWVHAAEHAGCAACANHITTSWSQNSVSGTAKSWAAGTKKLCVLRVDFDDLPGPPRSISGEITTSEILQTVNGPVAGFFKTASYGAASVSLESSAITEVLRLPDTAESYAQEAVLQRMEADAKHSAENAGYDLSKYDRVLILFSSFASVPNNLVRYTGFAWIGGLSSWFQGSFAPGLVAHELGHNLGLGHASLWRVAAGKTDPIDPSGQQDEYGHAYDIMGYSTYDPEHRNVFNPASLAYLGWLPEQSMQTITESGRYRVYPFDQQTPGLGKVLGLRIPLGTQRAYWFSHRFDYENLRHQLVVERADEAARTTLLLDMNPGGSLNDAALAEGRTFSESEIGIHAKVVETGGSAADAWVDLEVEFIPQVLFRQADLSVLEMSGRVELILERQRSSKGAVSVRWETEDRTAIASADYTTSGGIVIWEDGQIGSQSIHIPVLADSGEEHQESFAVRLTEVTGAIAPVREAVVHIIEPGTRDPSFESPEIRGLVRDIALQPDGKILIAGDFYHVGTSIGRGAGRLLSNGQVDSSFTMVRGANVTPVHVAAIDSSSKPIFGGAFRTFDLTGAEGLVRLFPEGGLDQWFFHTSLNGTVHDLVFLNSGDFFIAGDFSLVSGSVTSGLARLYADGTVDQTWGTEFPFGTLVTDVAVLPNEELYASGRFLGEDGLRYWGVLHLHADGSVKRLLGKVDTQVGGAYNSIEITKLALTPSRELIVTGDFSRFAGISCRGLVRLNEDGVVDQGFVDALGTGANGSVWDVAALSGGRLIVVGAFDQMNGITRHGVARLRANGSLDEWNPGEALKEELDWDALKGSAVALQADGGVVLGFSDLTEHQGRIFRVASGVSDLPGILEFETTEWQAPHGEELIVPVRRRLGDTGEVSVGFSLHVETSGESPTDTFHATPTGRLYWGNGDTQPKFIRAVLPVDIRASALELSLFEAQGGAQTSARAIARIQLTLPRNRYAWLATYFGVGSSAASHFGPHDDADEDGVSNLLEYALDRDPSSALSEDGITALPQVVLAAVGPEGDHCLELLANLPTELRDDLHYEILVQDGTAEPVVLAYLRAGQLHWVVGPESAGPVTFPSSEEGRQVVRFQDVIPAALTARRFMQLRVRLEE
jgi:hypothetical protein